MRTVERLQLLSPAGQPVAMRTEDKFLAPSVFPDGSQVGLYEPKHVFMIEYGAYWDACEDEPG